MPNSRRRLGRDDETEIADPATETFATIVALCGVLEPDEGDRLREMLASWLVGEAADPTPIASAAEDRRRRLGHGRRFAADALPRGVLPPEERYPNSARVRTAGSF